MSTRLAINGMGRIGRLVLRQVMPSEDLRVVAVNDIADPADIAYLLRHDSIYGPPDAEIRSANGTLVWGDQTIDFFSEKEPRKLPWKDHGVEIVIEATGAFRDRDGAAQHLEAGAERVIITAPGKDPDITLCMGINEEQYDPEKHRIISNASCTTNCLAPVAKVLDEAFGIETGFLTTVHAYTSSQSVVDSPSRKRRRGRAAAISIIPTSTGAAVATTEVLPQLAGKLDGMAMRVPVADGSIIDFVVHTRDPISKEKINQAFMSANRTERLKTILGVTREELVSADIVGNNYSALVDLSATMALGEHSAKVLAWYDNEWGYARRVRDLAAYVREQAAAGRKTTRATAHGARH